MDFKHHEDRRVEGAMANAASASTRFKEPLKDASHTTLRTGSTIFEVRLRLLQPAGSRTTVTFAEPSGHAGRQPSNTSSPPK